MPNFFHVSILYKFWYITSACQEIVVSLLIFFYSYLFQSRVSPSKGSASNSPDVSFDSGDGPSYPQVSSSSSHLQHNVPHASFSSSPYTSQNVSYPISAPQASSTPFTGSNNMANPYPSATHQSTSQASTPHASTYANRGSNGSLPKTPSTVKARKRSGGGRPFDPDASPAHLNFTYRREMEKQQHEKQLIENLRNVGFELF